MRVNVTKSNPEVIYITEISGTFGNYRLIRANRSRRLGIIGSPEGQRTPYSLSLKNLYYAMEFKINVKQTREVSEREAKCDSRGVMPRPRPVEKRKKISRGRRSLHPFHLVTTKWFDIVTLQKSSRVTIDGNLHFFRVSERCYSNNDKF